MVLYSSRSILQCFLNAESLLKHDTAKAPEGNDNSIDSEVMMKRMAELEEKVNQNSKLKSWPTEKEKTLKETIQRATALEDEVKDTKKVSHASLTSYNIIN